MSRGVRQLAAKESGVGRFAAGFALAASLLVALLATGAQQAAASHSWGSYHWGRAANPFTLKLRDHVAGGWNTRLASVSADWSGSSVLDTAIVERAETKRCRAVSGRVDVCNGRYGRTGWLGIAQVWTADGHIGAATAKVNDTYFGMPAYDSAEARQSVLCMEVGHSLGLGHQDGSSDSCMDDSSFDWPAILRPNGHDHEQLEAIYSHADPTGTVGRQAAGAGFWPKDAERVGESRYVERLGEGERLHTWVYWRGENAAVKAPAEAPR